MTVFMQLGLATIELTCFFGLLGLAYLVVLEGAGVFNLAIGPYAMIGALMVSSLVISQQWSIWAALVVAFIVVVALAILTEVAVIRPIEKRSRGSEFPALVALAALVFGLSQASGLIFGRLPLPGQMPFTFSPIALGGITIAPGLVLILGLTIVVYGSVTLIARLTPAGRALRAVGDNREAAVILGLRVGWVRVVSFAISGMIAFSAGIGIAAKTGVSYDVGLHWALLGFLALVIGGTGSWFAPLLGAVILAITQVFVPYFFGGGYADYVVLLFALIFFTIRPQGLYSRRVRA